MFEIIAAVVSLGVGLVSGITGLAKQNQANQQAQDEGQRQLDQAQKDAALMRLKNDAAYLQALRDAETKRQADVRAALAVAQRQSLTLGLLAVISFGIALYLLFRPTSRLRQSDSHTT